MVERVNDEDDLLAAELALRLLGDAEEASALLRCGKDAAFRSAVDQWNERVVRAIDSAGMASSAAPEWAGIAARLPGRSKAPSVRGWRIAAIGSGALAAGLVGILLFAQPMREAPPEPVSVAQLARPSGDTLAVAVYDRATATLRVRVADLSADAKVPELWIIPAGGTPRSLGALPRGSARDIVLDEKARAQAEAGATLAITLEPAAGVPHEAPSGTILGKAPLTAL